MRHSLAKESTQDVSASIRWPKLIQGVLVRRYKRFLADIRLRDGRIITAHCPNSGSMRGCLEPGGKVFLSRSENPRRSYPYTWELIETPGSLVCVNTLIANRLVSKAVTSRSVRSLSGYHFLRSEVKCSENSRLDLLLEASGGELCFVEIKSCTLVEDGVAYFPDAVTTRGRRHLIELQRQVTLGHRAVIFFLIQRADARVFRPADHIDPAYGAELRCAAQTRVEIQVYDVRLTPQEIELNSEIPWEL